MLATVPDSLLVHQCYAVAPQETLNSLVDAYIQTAGCLGIYKLQIDKIKEHKKQQLMLYSPK